MGAQGVSIKLRFTAEGAHSFRVALRKPHPNEGDFAGGNAALDQFALDLAVDAVTVESLLFGLDGVTALLFQSDLLN